MAAMARRCDTITLAVDDELCYREEVPFVIAAVRLVETFIGHGHHRLKDMRRKRANSSVAREESDWVGGNPHCTASSWLAKSLHMP